MFITEIVENEISSARACHIFGRPGGGASPLTFKKKVLVLIGTFSTLIKQNDNFL